MVQVRNRDVWNQVRIIFMGSAVLFLINITFGFDNAFTTGLLPRAQALIHLHAGSIGWITLSLIGLAIWIFTGEREVSESYVSRVRALTYAAIGIFGAYIVSFGIAYSRGGGFFVLLPIFGTGAMLMIWVAAAYALYELRRQPVTTTMHLLVAGGLLVAAVGATMGLLLGLEHAIGRFLPISPNDDRVGVHAGMMDTYIILVAAGIIEGLIASGPAKRWTRGGLLQTMFLTVAALLVPFGFLLGLVEELVPFFGLLLAAGLVTFLIRTGRRALAYNPLHGGIRAWTWFGSLWVVMFIVLFIFAADIRLGAIVMGIGVLLGVGTMLLRLRADRPGVPAAARTASAD